MNNINEERKLKLEKLIQTDIIEKYIQAMRPTTRAVEEFHLMCILNIVSALILRKVYVKQGTSQIYPNLYSLIVAPSSRAKKSTATDNFAYWMKRLNMSHYLISNIGSLEGLGDALKGNDEDSGLEKKEGVGFVHLDEFGTLLSSVSKKNGHLTGLLDHLNKLYACGDFKISYRNKPINIETTYLNIIGATQLDSLTRYIQEHVLLSGFFPRFLICYETYINPHIAFRPLPDDIIMNDVEARFLEIKQFIDDLGLQEKQYKLSNSSKQFFERWSFKCDEVSANFPNSIQTMMGRNETLFFKLCLIIHFIKGNFNNNIIDLNTTKYAIQIVNWHVINYKNLILGDKENGGGLAFNDNHRKMQDLEELIRTKKELTLSDIKRSKGWDSREIAECMDALYKEYIIDIEKGLRGGLHYKFVEPGDRERKYQEERNNSQ